MNPDAVERPCPFPPRVVVTGGEAGGKTTLAQQLAAWQRTVWIPEYSRSYAESVGRLLTVDDVAVIARGQEAREEAAFGLHLTTPARDRPIILDTDLVSTTVYSEHYYGSCAPWIMALAKDRLADLYLLCEPDLAWEADGVRDQPHARAELHARFVVRLRELGALVLPVHGYGSTRLEVAMAAVRGWEAGRAGSGTG